MRLRRPVLPHQTDSGNQRAAFWPQGICTPISFCGKRGGLLGRSWFLKGGVLAAPSFVFSPGVKGEALRYLP